MKRVLFLCIIIIITIISFPVFAQNDTGTGDRAQQVLKDITVEQFEIPGFWHGAISGDAGVILLNTREGKPKELAEGNDERLKQDEKYNLPSGKYVLGVKVHFYKRAVTTFSLYPTRPIPIEGISKRISVWVVGRNFKHKLIIIVEDYLGTRHELAMGILTFRGWQKLSVTVPGHIVQDELHYTSTSGLKVVGFKVECDLMEAYGTFYMYLDDISAETDLFAEEYKDEDDILDNW